MQFIIGALVSGIAYLFRNRLGLFVASAIAWLGLSFVTQKVLLQPAMDTLLGYAGDMQGGSGLAAIAGQWIGMLKFDVALTMLISAYGMRQAIQQGRVFLAKRGA